MRKKLSEMGYGEEGIVESIEASLRYKIAGIGIREGKKIRMATRQPLKGPIVVEVDNSFTSLGLGIAEKIIVAVR